MSNLIPHGLHWGFIKSSYMDIKMEFFWSLEISGHLYNFLLRSSFTNRLRGMY